MYRVERRGRVGVAMIAAVVGAAACAGGETGSDDTSPGTAATAAPTTDSVATTGPPSTPPPATTDPPGTTTTTEPPLPEPVTRSRLVVDGPEEIVFDWTTDQCEPAHIPDIAARAFRDAAGNVQLTIGHWNTYRMIGPHLDEVVSDCSTIQLRSDYDPDPAAFNDSEWIGSPYTLDGNTVYAVVHNEYRGDTHTATRPGQCPSGQRLACLDTSFTMAVSTDGGATFTDIAEPPNHLIATLPYTYLDDSVPSGIRQPSDVIEGPDGYHYLFGNVSDQPDEEQWVCAMRTDDLADPSAWRYWDGAEFAGEWKNPYLEPVDPDADKCAPLADGALGGSVQESIVFDEVLGRYVMVGVSAQPTGAEPQWGVYVSTSENLIDWSLRELLLEIPVNPSVANPDTDTVHAYPSIIDPDSPSLNFSTSDGEMFLYLSRFNFGGSSLDRDLVRWPIRVDEYVAPAPDWAFDDERDIDPSSGGWSAVNDLQPLTVSDGILELVPTGIDPYMEAGGLAVPAEYDRVKLLMRQPDGVSGVAEFFWLTDQGTEWSESRLVVFEVDGTGDFVEYELDLSAEPGWAGTITALRLDPIEGSDAVAAIDRLWFPLASS